MKKVFSILLAVFMLFCCFATPTKAEEEKGSITINGASKDNVYEIYKLLDLESYDTTSGAYSYKVNSAWTGFFATDDAKIYVKIDDAGYVTWVEGKDSPDDVAAFSKLALAYAKDSNPKIAPVQSSKTEGQFVITTDPKTNITSGKFSNLELGYYLVDSTMGALCGLTTTNPDASINAKNGAPTLDKQVLEDSTNQFGGANTADIGQIVTYRVTINVHQGAENYVFHDKMSAGLTYQEVTSIEHVVPGTPNKVTSVPVDYYEVKDENLEDDCTFEIEFTKDFTDHLKTNDKIVITYTAMLNRNAVIAGEGNTNEAKLEYGENHFTSTDKVTTRTFRFDIIKTDSQNTLINGAKFKIYDAATGGNEVAVVLTDDGITYRRARTTGENPETGIEIEVKNGKVRVVGFDNGTYYLEETEAPDGYNKLTSRQAFTISDGNLDAVFNGSIYSSGSGVHVVNKTGSMLPETGAMGTTLFIIGGGFAVLVAGLLLFAKMRMSQLEEK